MLSPIDATKTPAALPDLLVLDVAAVRPDCRDHRCIPRLLRPTMHGRS